MLSILGGANQKAPKIVEHLKMQGFQGANLFAKIKYKGQEVNAYPSPVCVAILAYYAFSAGKSCTKEAQASSLMLIGGKPWKSTFTTQQATTRASKLRIFGNISTIDCFSTQHRLDISVSFRKHQSWYSRQFAQVFWLITIQCQISALGDFGVSSGFKKA